MEMKAISAEDFERVKNCTCNACQWFRRSNGLSVIKTSKNKKKK